MKLWVILCVSALAGAENTDDPFTTDSQLALLYRRFLRVAAPKQLQLMDALDVTWQHGYLIGPVIPSPRKIIIDGEENGALSFANTITNPMQKGESRMGWWYKNLNSDTILAYHYGASFKVHMITEGGNYTEAVLGNPLDDNHKDAKFLILIPKTTLRAIESLHQDEFSFYSYVNFPAWTAQESRGFAPDDMKSKFPEHAELFSSLAKPAFSHHDYPITNVHQCSDIAH